MDTNIKNSLVLAGSAIAGGLGGSWAATRLGAALGLSLGPWGSAIGGMLGAMASTALAKKFVGEPQPMFGVQPMVEEAIEEASEADLQKA